MKDTALHWVSVFFGIVIGIFGYHAFVIGKPQQIPLKVDTDFQVAVGTTTVANVLDCEEGFYEPKYISVKEALITCSKRTISEDITQRLRKTLDLPLIKSHQYQP